MVKKRKKQTKQLSEFKNVKYEIKTESNVVKESCSELLHRVAPAFRPLNASYVL